MSNYKGKSSILELMEMPNWMFHGLYVKMVQRLSTDEGRKEAGAETLIEGLTGGM